MSNELTTDLAAQLPSKYNDLADKMSEGTGFLPYMQLFIANSKPCKGGKFPINHYGIPRGEKIDDLGEEVDVLLLAWRPKAIDTSGEDFVVSFDNDSEIFKSIQERSSIQDSGCMWGPDLLVYIPSIKKYATFMLSSISARNVFPEFNERMPGPATLHSQHIVTSKNDWYTTDVRDCSAPLDTPPIEEMKEQCEKFLNPPAPTSEVDTEDDGDGREV